MLVPGIGITRAMGTVVRRWIQPQRGYKSVVNANTPVMISNSRVYCRLRPPSDKEIAQKDGNLLTTLKSILGLFHLAPSNKREIQILKDFSGIIKPSRMTLLLGPPGAGKTTLLLALARKLDFDLRSSGRITYYGHELNEFVAGKMCAYISEHDIYYGEMTVRETLGFSGRCLGVGTRYKMLVELSRRDRDAGIKPDPEIDAFVKAIAMSGQKTILVTDYVLKILGMDICADIMVGDEMRRGISGGQKKRLTTGFPRKSFKISRKRVFVRLLPLA
ncbi:ABC transporter G member 34 [Stylosanthes scabra]|uniref:ABC transporter G member 34 n=1 Tax=Stylosanthes scabra TaxID=79078 RepID=A0ABU6QHB5_9FABA|nr:ABC transporter G member 34 [Stylosanthes scabra]